MQDDLLKNHARRVLAVVGDVDSQLTDTPIARSWLRCIDTYGIDPAQCHQTTVLEQYHLREHQQRLEEILAIARAEMNNLYQQIAGSGFAIILTDHEGVILHTVTDPALRDGFTRAGLWLGAIWSEEKEGTNGIGTCLTERHPLTVHRDEHFRGCHIHLTCSASPIFDPQGRLLAVLDASSVNSQDSKQSQFHTLALSTLSAKIIENCHFLQSFRRHWVLRFHQRPEFVGLLSEGMLAFDGEGRILAANQSALNQLDYPERAQLVGHGIAEVFAIDLDTLLGRASRQAEAVWPARDWRGRNHFALLRGPERHPLDSKATCVTIEPAAGPLAMTLDSLEGQDPLMAYNARCARRVMDRPVTILLQGETGVGKEAFARAIHNASQRAGKPFVAFNCASIPETLIESELFGYKHGAFTGARREGRRGKILQANGGTLFLDEIGDMPPALQTRLLRVLEEKEVLPLGTETPIPVALYVISATHRNLQARVASGEFREDLYYRLNGLILTLPPLRERADRALLIHSLLAAEGGNQAVQLHESAFAALLSYRWPGNIRQLRNVLRTALALCEEGVIRLQDLPPEIAQVSATELARLSRQLDKSTAESENTLACAEKEALLQTLQQHRWNITQAAAGLGISRNTLYRKMRKRGIKPPTLG